MGKAIAGKRICVACQVTVLSRYNPDPLCAPCGRSAREASGIVPVWVWDSAPLRAALARMDLAAFAVLARRASGLSLEGLGAVVAEGWSEALMSRIEAGLRDTLYDIRKLLVFTDALGMPRAALAPLLLGDPDATLDSDHAAALQEGDAVGLGRREFTTMSAGLAMAALLPVPQRVDRAHVRYLQATLARLRGQHHTVGGGAVFAQCLQLFGQARRMLDESDYSAPIGRELLVVTADLGIESAWFAFDADNQPLARRLNEETALLADCADTGEQCVHLYINMVHQATYLAHHTGRLGFAREALRFADRAADAVRHEPSPALRAFVSLRRSLVHAQLGDEAGFRSAITTARRELDRGPHDTDPKWTGFLDHPEITSIEAGGNVHLGAPARAVQLYQSALDNSALSLRGAAITRSKLAEALVAAGDLDQAIAQGLMILPDLGTTLSSGVVLQQLRPVREAAAGPAAAEFCERFDVAARALRAA